MQYRGPLMIEHRLIERMISVINGSLQKIEEDDGVDPRFIDTLVDFFRVYADRTHHGKEEDILFEDLKHRDLSQEDNERMQVLIREHVYGRQVVSELEQANRDYQEGKSQALQTIKDRLRTLTEFYPKHIDLEDRIFFPAVLNSLSDEDQQSLLDRFWDFDRTMIQEKYTAVVEHYEKE